MNLDLEEKKTQKSPEISPKKAKARPILKHRRKGRQGRQGRQGRHAAVTRRRMPFFWGFKQLKIKNVGTVQSFHGLLDLKQPIFHFISFQGE